MSRPKRNISAFMFFVKLNKERVRYEIAETTGSKLSPRQIGRCLGQRWENLGDEKKMYVKLSNQDRQRYKDEILNARSVCLKCLKQTRLSNVRTLRRLREREPPTPLTGPGIGCAQ